MSTVKITINGVICDMYGRTISGPVKIVGEAMYTGLGVGGGPIDPGGGGEGGEPPGIWGGGNEGFPTHPIAPGGRPPGIWGGGNEPFPTPPIVIPPEKPGDPPLVIWGPNDPRPTPPIELPGGGNPPPGGDRVKLIEWKTAWTPSTGWIVVGIPQVPHPAPAKK